MELEQDFGTFIRVRLRGVGLSQSEAAKRGGFSRQSLLNWMNGDVRRIELMNIVRLANVLDVSPYYCLQRVCRQLSLEIRSDEPALYRRDHSSFIRDVSVPDNTPVLVGQRFVKEWEIMNTGVTTWRGRFLTCMESEPARASNGLLGGYLRPDAGAVPVPETRPGESVVLGVVLTAPELPGTVRSEWKLVDADGLVCFPELAGVWCQVRVMLV